MFLSKTNVDTWCSDKVLSSQKKQLVDWVTDTPPKLTLLNILEGGVLSGASCFCFFALRNFKLLNLEEKINGKINLRQKYYKA